MEETIVHTEPFVDFSLQFNLAKNNEKVENCIFESLKEIAQLVYSGATNKIGALVVVGDFEKFGPKIKGMVQMKPKQNPIEKLTFMDHECGPTIIKEFSSNGFDGAIVINKNGQVIGAGVYLVIDDPMLETPDDCGTRHKAAASFSKRSDIISVLTLSEETNTVRIWQNGKIKEVFRVSGAEDDEKQKTKRKTPKIIKESEE